MKQKILIFALMFVLGTAAVAQPKHRHHAVAETTAVVTNAAANANADEGVEAFSDTTSIAEENATVPHVYVDDDFDFDDFEDFEDMPRWLRSLLGGSVGVFGGIFLILMLVFAVLLALAPFVALVLILRYLIRQHNDRVTLASKAMESGQPIPEELMPVDKQSDEYLRRRGIRNIWIGIGMAIMFGFWDADLLTGVGFLVLCYGIGQVFIARSSKKKNDVENMNP
ncbi:MAG: hypothetical protein IKS94_06980 [Prevotella sp.]|nr:hypothetical protein [Prevotella sp.]